MPQESQQWVEKIHESPSFDFRICSVALATLQQRGNYRDAEQLKGILGMRLWQSETPADFETDGHDLSVLVRPDQQQEIYRTFLGFGIKELEPIGAPPLRAFHQRVTASLRRVLHRQLRLTWKKSSGSEDAAPHALDFYEADDALIAVLTIRKPNGNQTMRIPLPEGVCVDDIADAWKGEWAFDEPSTTVDGVFYHVRYFPLPGGKFIIWKVHHPHDAPDDECYLADAVPTMEEAFADGE